MYYRDRRHKTADYRDWELAAIEALNRKEVQAELAKIRSNFDENKHSLFIKFNFQFPATTLLNKQGLISSRAEDLSNIEKTLLDVLCLPKFFVQSPPHGYPNLNIDDKHVLRLVSSKTISPTNKYQTKVSITLIRKPMQTACP